MKRATFGCLMAVVLGLSSARPAQANIGGLLDYIGGLSGPGPFGYRPAFFLDVPCWEGAPDDPKVIEALKNGGHVPLTLRKRCDGTLRGPRRSIGFFISTPHDTDQIPASYSYSPEQQALMKEITGGIVEAIPFGMTFKTTIPYVKNESVRRTFDIGGTLGLVVFRSGEANGDTLFDTFAVPLVELPRVQVRPLAPFACMGRTTCPDSGTWWDIFEITVGARIIGGVTSEDFGAAPGVDSGVHVMKILSAGVSFRFK